MPVTIEEKNVNHAADRQHSRDHLLPPVFPLRISIVNQGLRQSQTKALDLALQDCPNFTPAAELKVIAILRCLQYGVTNHLYCLVSPVVFY